MVYKATIEHSTYFRYYKLAFELLKAMLLATSEEENDHEILSIRGSISVVSVF